MSKLFNIISVPTSLIIGFILQLLGGYDKFLYGLICVVIIDYLSGIINAMYNQKLSSKIGFKGILKKVMIFLVVALSVVIENIIGTQTPVREIVIIFYISNEGISILENASQFLPIPQKFKDMLLQLRETNGGEEVKQSA